MEQQRPRQQGLGQDLLRAAGGRGDRGRGYQGRLRAGARADARGAGKAAAGASKWQKSVSALREGRTKFFWPACGESHEASSDLGPNREDWRPLAHGTRVGRWHGPSSRNREVQQETTQGQQRKQVLPFREGVAMVGWMSPSLGRKAETKSRLQFWAEVADHELSFEAPPSDASRVRQGGRWPPSLSLSLSEQAAISCTCCTAMQPLPHSSLAKLCVSSP